MISSAVSATHTVRLGGTAEGSTPNSSKPRPVQQHRDGARRTASPTNATKEAATYE